MIAKDALDKDIVRGDWVFCVSSKGGAIDGCSFRVDEVCESESGFRTVEGSLGSFPEFETVKLEGYNISRDAETNDRVVFIDDDSVPVREYGGIIGASGIVLGVDRGFVAWLPYEFNTVNVVHSSGRQLAKIPDISCPQDDIHDGDWVVCDSVKKVFRVRDVMPFSLSDDDGFRYPRSKSRKLERYSNSAEVTAGDLCVVVRHIGDFAPGELVKVSMPTFDSNKWWCHSVESKKLGYVSISYLAKVGMDVLKVVDTGASMSVLGLYTRREAFGISCCEVSWDSFLCKYMISGRDDADMPINMVEDAGWSGPGDGWEKVKEWKPKKCNIGWDPL